tara:strand:- start:9775 stop:10074 length:300 start_codon:yes stop_codon:yes gene_type:complete
LALGLEPSVTVGVLNNLVGHLLDVALDLGIGELAADETLCGKESVFGVDNGLALGGDADEALALLGEANNGRCCAATWTGLNKSSKVDWVAMTYLLNSQ